jgi:HEAT repeat protein
MNPGTPADALGRGDAVFLGEVISEIPLLNEDQKKRKEQGRPVYIRNYKYLLKVEKAWKGVEGKTVTLISETKRVECGFGRLKVGQRFLFYAYKSSRKKNSPKPVLGTSNCTRSRSADSAVIEVLFLDAAVQNVDPATIFRQLPTVLKSHANPLYRVAAARYLRYDIPSPFPEGTVKALLAGLNDRDPRVRETVAEVIRGQDFGKHQKIWSSALNQAYGAEKKRLEQNPESLPISRALRSIAGALVVYGDREAHLKLIPYFIEDLKNEKSSTHYVSMARLMVIGSEARSAVPVLKLMLNHKDRSIRQRAMEALRAIQPQGSLYEITKGLDDDNCEVVTEAVKALDEIESPKAKKILTEKGIPRLIEKKDAPICMFSRYVLGELGVPLASHVPQMITVLNPPMNKNRNSIARVMQEDIIEILSNIGPKAHRAVPILERALNDPDENIRRATQSALDSIQAYDFYRSKPALTELEKRLESSETFQWYRTVYRIRNFQNSRALKILNNKVVPRLIRKWQKGNLTDHESLSLIECLEELSPEVGGIYPIFMEALMHPDERVRLHALTGLRKLGKAGKPAVPQLIKLLNESKGPDDWISHNIVLTLEALDTPQGKEAISEYASKNAPKLLEILTGDDAISRRYVSGYLVPLVPYSENLFSHLTALLQTTDDFVMRQEILKVMEKLGVQAQSAVPVIMTILNNQGLDDEVLWRRVEKLIREMKALGPDHPDVSSKRFALLKILKSPQLITRMHGMEALLSIGTSEAMDVAEQYRRRVLPYLKQMVASPYRKSREQGVVFTVHLSRDSKAAVSILASALKDNYGKVRWKAAQGLKDLGSLAALAVPVLATLWDDEYHLVRSLIPSVLKVIGTPEALQVLQ